NVLEDARRNIPRIELERQLDKWWRDGANSPAALLGDEGRGKTWSALSWCSRRVQDADAPMILAVSAKDIGSGDAEEVLAKALSVCIPSARTELLARRLRRWARSARSLKIVLLVDGLNERWEHQWHEFVRAFDVEP